MIVFSHQTLPGYYVLSSTRQTVQWAEINPVNFKIETPWKDCSSNGRYSVKNFTVRFEI